MTSYTYTTGIPNPPSTPASNVSDMQVNTNSASSIWETDHVGFNSTGPTMTGTGGMHLQCQFCGNNVPSDPPAFPTLFVNDQDGNSHTLPNSISQLFFYSGASAVGASQYYIQNSSGAAGSTFMLGGIIVKWGVVSASDNTSIGFATASGSAFPNNCFGVSLTLYNSSSSSSSAFILSVSPTPTASAFTPRIRLSSGSTGSASIFYLAIGN